jgi:TetR/AcrR family transcriptional regulator
VSATKRLVESPSRARPAAPRPGTRARLFHAAAAEFAARGFAGASVDRIARSARVNKAMIYYHFRSKAALYQEILGEMFEAVAARLQAIAESGTDAGARLHAYIDAIAAEAEARPHFPPIWFREVAEGGGHLAPRTLRDIAGIVQTLAAIVQEGVREGRFAPISPVLVHAGIVGPLLLYFASGALRERLARAGLAGASAISRDDVVAHVYRVTLGVLEGRV